LIINNIFDNKPILSLIKNIRGGGKLFGDKGYLCKEAVRKELQEERNITLITKSRKNMKNKKEKDLDYVDKFFLSRRGVIETVIGQIKEKTNIINVKIKNLYNYITNIITALVTYQIKEKKPTVWFGEGVVA
jgi:hypothetical protein